jgi:hypothetical protein
MLLAQLERQDDEYVLRIPRHEVVQHDLREGQILGVVIEPLEDFGAFEVDSSERQAESWKLNEVKQQYRANDR